MTVTGSLPLHQLSDSQLVEGLRAGAVGWQDFGEAVKRKARAEKAARARTLARMRWHDAAHAQFTEAETACRGVLLSARGLEHGPADAFGLWSGPWADVQRWASEELLLWFGEPGHERLTFQAWQRQGSAAAEARRARDERDLAQMGNGQSHQGLGQSHQQEGRTGRPTVAPMGEAQIARYTAALAAYGSRAAAPQPGSIARYTARLEALTDQLTRQASRLAKATQSHQ